MASLGLSCETKLLRTKTTLEDAVTTQQANMQIFYLKNKTIVYLKFTFVILLILREHR